MSDSWRPHGPQPHQASLSITNSQSSPKLMSIESVMSSKHFILWINFNTFCYFTKTLAFVHALGILYLLIILFLLVQFSSVAQSCPTLCNPTDCSTQGFPVLHHFLEFAQTHVHWISDAIQPSHPLSSPSPPAFNLSQHQGLFQWVSSSHQVARGLDLQLQHKSFQWTW